MLAIHGVSLHTDSRAQVPAVPKTETSQTLGINHNRYQANRRPGFFKTELGQQNLVR